MTKTELAQLQKAVHILDKESERAVYGEDEVIAFENATALLLAALRAASLEVEEEEPSPDLKVGTLAVLSQLLINEQGFPEAKTATFQEDDTVEFDFSAGEFTKKQ